MSRQTDTHEPSQPHADTADRFLFLSYNGLDREIVQSVQQRLKGLNIPTFFDREQLNPGLPWFDALQDAIGNARALAVFIGKDGLGTWQKREMELALQRQAREEKIGGEFPVIPVVLEGVDLENVPGFLLLNTWIDLRRGIDDNSALDAMARAVLGKPSSLQPTVPVALCPYRALRAFREEDAPLFFGREGFASELLRKVVSEHLVLVVGPSGSGKTSVVQAGLLPLLRKEQSPSVTWDVVIVSPGKRPFHNLAAALLSVLEGESNEIQRVREAEAFGNDLISGKVAVEAAVLAVKKASGSDRVLLVVDQFEELFTLTPESERRSFIEALLESVSMTPVTLLLTLRADFYGQVIDASRDLSDRMQRGVVNLGAMMTEELRRVIQSPARTVGLEFESGLTERILEHIEDRPGTLPLLEFSLTSLWEMRLGKRLTNRAYDKIGGIKGAISQRAELQFNKLNTQQQESVLRLLTRLGTISGDDRPYTRQPVNLDDLDESQRGVVQSFVSARLLVTSRNELTGEETVEVAHEALIKAWTRLKDFLDNDKQFYLWRQRLDLKRDEWQNAEKDHELLLRGSVLLEARKHLRHRPEDFTDSERVFIESSELASRRPRRRLLTLSAAAVFLLAIIAGVMFWVRTDSYQMDSILTQSSTLTQSASAPAIRRWAKALTYAGKLDEAVSLARNIEESEQRALALSDIANALTRMQKTEDAQKIIREAQVTATEIGQLGKQYTAFKMVIKELTKLRTADECLSSISEISTPTSRTQGLVVLAEIFANSERIDDASRVIDTALPAARSINDAELRAYGLTRIAESLSTIKKMDRAQEVINESLVAAKDIRNPSAQSLVYAELTKSQFKVGDLDKGTEIARLTYSTWQRVPTYRSVLISRIVDALVKAGKGEEVFDEALASWNTDFNVLANPLEHFVSVLVAMDENGMRDKALAKISNIQDPDLKNYCFGAFALNLSGKGEIDEAIQILSNHELPTYYVTQFISTLILSGKKTEALKLAQSFQLSTDPLVLLAIAGRINEDHNTTEALTAARKINVPNVKAFAFSVIAQEVVDREKPENAQAIIDEALTATQNVSHDRFRSAIYTVLAVSQAGFKDFRNARLTAENCSSSDEKLLVYRSILLEYLGRHDIQLAALLDDDEKERKETFKDLKLEVSISSEGLRYTVEFFPSDGASE